MSEEQVPAKMLAGFWIRVFADLIDIAVLWAVAMLLGFVMESWFVKLGNSGVWLGLLISIAYFVPLQSGLGNGQSLGKRALGIQVLDINGRPLTLAKSFLRYLVIAYVGYFGVFTGVVNSMVGSSLSAVVGTIMGTIWFIASVGCYLLLPLHPLKRGIHDLVADSIVVYRDQFNATALASLNSPAKSRRALTILGVVSAVAIVIGLGRPTINTQNAHLLELQELAAKLESSGKFSATRVVDNTFSGPGGTTRTIVVQAYVGGPIDQTADDLKPRYDLAFQAIRDQIKDLSAYNNLRVGLRLGYDLGIRTRYITLFQDENPSKFGERREAGSNSHF